MSEEKEIQQMIDNVDEKQETLEDEFVELAGQLAEVHIGDGDELGVIAKRIHELIKGHYPEIYKKFNKMA